MQPSFVYGDRYINKDSKVPLGILGRPLAWLTQLPLIRGLRQSILEAAFVPPVAVEQVAAATADAVEGKISGKVTVDEILKY